MPKLQHCHEIQLIYGLLNTQWLLLNLVVYTFFGRVCWASGTNGHQDSVLVMQDDGNLVIYNTVGRPVWASNTCQSGLSITREKVSKLFNIEDHSRLVDNKFRWSGVPIWDSSSKLIANLCNLSRIVDKSKNWWHEVEVFDLEANIKANIE